MKKKGKLIAILSIGVCVCILIFGGLYLNGYFTKCNPYNGAVKINDEYYRGNSPIYEMYEQIFVSVEEIAMEFDFAYDVQGIGKTKTLIIDGKETATIQMLKGKEYIALHELKNLPMGVHVSENCVPYEGTIYIDNFVGEFSYDWTEQPYIMHAFGAVGGGNTLTNSLEAFEENYAAGCRVFEVDLTLTSDNKLVALHDWSESTTCNTLGMNIPEEKRGMPLTEEEYLELKVLGKYTTLSFKDVAELMNEYPDIYIVTDTKETLEPYVSMQFDLLIKTAEEVNPEILDRIIPQMYNEEMYYTIMNMYNWKSMIYTVYGLVDDYSEKQVMDFAYQNGIRVVTMFESRAHELFIDELTERDILVFMHTYNSQEEFERIKRMGADGVYTDLLRPTP